ncbi:hypothetical protein I307_01643 [Cryptococcus deuterogattii 99/473]|uniref:Uncharacterized protein n=1 Tax=Cryptococcus deuterogattii Ram5 TaxID=1296110 RepID=A0A0D0UUN9_9TREE|nr:hypothetical protein I313_05077 [Cryptococcus deuterogattii Ram5]KIR75963.1 hypothetical protein I310_00662 [Cryptococcus deuterogattii CA1014]KIY58849.1 hypothetical protein I307_01643 [Cryptococcus deuterogattii 99/473]
MTSDLFLHVYTSALPCPTPNTFALSYFVPFFEATPPPASYYKPSFLRSSCAEPKIQKMQMGQM